MIRMQISFIFVLGLLVLIGCADTVPSEPADSDERSEQAPKRRGEATPSAGLVVKHDSLG